MSRSLSNDERAEYLLSGSGFALVAVGITAFFGALFYADLLIGMVPDGGIVVGHWTNKAMMSGVLFLCTGLLMKTAALRTSLRRRELDAAVPATTRRTLSIGGGAFAIAGALVVVGSLAVLTDRWVALAGAPESSLARVMVHVVEMLRLQALTAAVFLVLLSCLGGMHLVGLVAEAAATAATGEQPDRAERPAFLFRLSSFVLVVIAVFVAFAVYVLGNELVMTIVGMSYERSMFVTKGFLVATMILAVGVMMRSYGACVLLGALPSNRPAGGPVRQTWLLKVAAIAFLAGAVVIVVGTAALRASYLERSLAVASDGTGVLLFLTDSISVRSFIVALFLMGIAQLSLIHLSVAGLPPARSRQ